jgi:hypothetical protein
VHELHVRVRSYGAKACYEAGEVWKEEAVAAAVHLEQHILVITKSGPTIIKRAAN